MCWAIPNAYRVSIHPYMLLSKAKYKKRVCVYAGKKISKLVFKKHRQRLLVFPTMVARKSGTVARNHFP